MDSNLTSYSSRLRTRLLEGRVRVDDGGRWIIPQSAVRELLSKEEIRSVVSDCARIQAYQVDELVEITDRGAQKTFAILVLLKGEERHILRFVESDGLQQASLDHRLPFHKAAVRALVPDEIVEDFYDMQWAMVAPFFSRGIIHRVFAPESRMPFVLDEDTCKEGGFGHIWEVGIHHEYHDVPLLSNGEGHRRLVRKEFFTHSSGHGAFKQEIHNLNLLTHVKHPNIVESLGSFTHKGKHNVLFPRASAGDLSTLMAAQCRPPYFSKDSDLFKALSELASAVQQVHRYASRSIDLAIIRVHHDLKPQNVLVHDGSFVLVDFGLCKFKPADATSKSLFQVGGGHYLAPECEDYENGFEKHTI